MKKIMFFEDNVKKIRDLELNEVFSEEEYELLQELKRKLKLVRLLIRLKDKLNITDEELTLLKALLK